MAEGAQVPEKAEEGAVPEGIKTIGRGPQALRLALVLIAFAIATVVFASVGQWVLSAFSLIMAVLMAFFILFWFKATSKT
ncbi:MAG: hypothetical protein MUE65_02320 [Methanomassiliicoccales archaeon]|jgi:hypothetical protein|nr:hypothetical protein [Methanomassiliicoccales archaeon]